MWCLSDRPHQSSYSHRKQEVLTRAPKMPTLVSIMRNYWSEKLQWRKRARCPLCASLCMQPRQPGKDVLLGLFIVKLGAVREHCGFITDQWPREVHMAAMQGIATLWLVWVILRFKYHGLATTACLGNNLKTVDLSVTNLRFYIFEAWLAPFRTQIREELSIVGLVSMLSEQ